MNVQLNSSNSGTGSIELSPKDFDRICRLAKKGWGLNLDEAKKPLIRSRLSKRVNELGLSDFDVYCDLIQGGNTDEQEHFVNALTTNVTHFYRELHHFEYLEEKVLPELIARARKGGRVRIWSAGCSTGKEPYSIAGSILKLSPDAHSLNIRILATDIDASVLSKAEAGIYRNEDCSFPSDARKSLVFEKTKSDQPNWTVRPDVQSLVTVRKLNLVDEWPMKGPFDVIMCRNVAIYFDKPTQAAIWKQFRRYLPEDGHLFIGHSERIIAPETMGFALCATTTYRAVVDPNAKFICSKG